MVEPDRPFEHDILLDLRLYAKEEAIPFSHSW